jgi:hypothetical protein
MEPKVNRVRWSSSFRGRKIGLGEEARPMAIMSFAVVILCGDFNPVEWWGKYTILTLP